MWQGSQIRGTRLLRRSVVTAGDTDSDKASFVMLARSVSEGANHSLCLTDRGGEMPLDREMLLLIVNEPLLL